MTHLIAYLVGFLLAMCPVKNHAPPLTPGTGETPEEVTARYEAVAQDIAAVLLDPDETPLYTGDHGRERGALVLAALAFEESGMRKDVDEGLCKKGDPRGDSDSCGAFTMWQIHTAGGLVLDGTGFKVLLAQPAAWQAEHTKDALHATDILHDRKKAVRLALHMAHVSIDNWTRGRAAKGDAQRWWAAHPF
jgi:hypothetical protein